LPHIYHYGAAGKPNKNSRLYGRREALEKKKKIKGGKGRKREGALFVSFRSWDFPETAGKEAEITSRWRRQPLSKGGGKEKKRKKERRGEETPSALLDGAFFPPSLERGRATISFAWSVPGLWEEKKKKERKGKHRDQPSSPLPASRPPGG